MAPTAGRPLTLTTAKGPRMTVKDIITNYGGCRFRSRLEGRWAVFLDYMGIDWQYERRELSVSYRLTQDAETFPYLPNFFLPGLGLWVEVKGELDEKSTVRLLNVAASLSSNDGGGCHDNGGHDLVVLGPIPKPGSACFPVRLHMHKGDLIASQWNCTGYGWDCLSTRNTRSRTYGSTVIGRDQGGYPFADLSPSRTTEMLLHGRSEFVPGEFVAAALSHARQARFEHGESG